MIGPLKYGRSKQRSATDAQSPYSNNRGTPFAFWGSPVFEQNGKLVCPGFTQDQPITNAWDLCQLGGDILPGIATVDIQKERQTEKKKAADRDGARITVRGIDAASISIQLLIWTPEQLRDLNRLWPILFPPPGKQPAKPPMFDIQHPMAELHGVKSIQVISGSGPSPAGVARARIFNIRAIEYLPPGKKSATSSAAQPKGTLLDQGANAAPAQALPSSFAENIGRQAE